MDANWSFLTKPKWLLSHLFVMALLTFFVLAGLWQVGRLAERKAANDETESRIGMPAVGAEEALSLGEGMWNYRPARLNGHYVQPEMIRVANRSFDGVAGEWSVGVFQTDSGQLILVNRGFIQRDAQTAPPGEETEITGWYRDSEVGDGAFSVADDGASERAPRLNTNALGERYGAEVAPFWVQLIPGDERVPIESDPAANVGSVAVDPAPIGLPPLNNGSHFSYAVQWFTFTALGGVAYLLALRKLARQKAID